MALGILDFERAAKISGSPVRCLPGHGGVLERALISFMLDLHTPKARVRRGPASLHREGPGARGDGTASQVRAGPLQGGRGRVLPDPYGGGPGNEPPPGRDPRREASCRIRYCAFTPCFRSRGGLLREGHQGDDPPAPVPQGGAREVRDDPRTSYQELEALTADAEAVSRAWPALPKVTLCTGDMCFSSAKTYDLEVWLPSQGRFREISSCSNFEDFQARRANIRYRPAGAASPRSFTRSTAPGSPWPDASGPAGECQRSDGSVGIPSVLRP